MVRMLHHGELLHMVRLLQQCEVTTHGEVTATM